MSFQIAIDGPSASGKSTIAQILAKKITGFYVNTGNMYRALTACCLDAKIDIKNENEVKKIINSNDIFYQANGELLNLMINDSLADMSKVRSPEVTNNVSTIASYAAARTWLVDKQRQSADLGNIVMEGRDIGTVVFPKAKYKFFITATPEERARRRLAQPGETIDGTTLAKVAADIALRDKIDSERNISPLKPANDSIFIDTTNLTIDQVVEFICQKITQN